MYGDKMYEGAPRRGKMYGNTALVRSSFFADRQEKPRMIGLTEIRGPSHSFMGPHFLEEILGSTGSYIDGLKFASSLMPHSLLKDMIKLAHCHGVYVSSGGCSEHILSRGRNSFKQFIKECKDLGFDMIEFDTFSDKISEDDFLHLTRMIKSEGLKAKPGLLLDDEDAESILDSAERFLGAGADVLRVESDTEFHTTDVIAKLIERVGLDKLMFEAADPKIFEWYIRNYGRGVNLFVNHSHVMELECLRSGWAMAEHRRLFLS